MTNPTVAPKGAILALLAIDAHADVSGDLQEATDWLLTFGLIGPDDAMITALTDKGRAWLDLILATPLPVQLAVWGDPRAERSTMVSLADVAAMIRSAPPAAAPVAPTGMTDLERLRIASTAQTDVFVLPAGFNPNRYGNLKPGELPAGMKRDDDLEVIHRRRRRNKAGDVVNVRLPAQAVIFTLDPAVEKPDDVLAYRILADGLSADSPALTGTGLADA